MDRDNPTQTEGLEGLVSRGMFPTVPYDKKKLQLLEEHYISKNKKEASLVYRHIFILMN